MKRFPHLNKIAVTIDKDRKHATENATVCVVASLKSLEKVLRCHFGNVGSDEMISGVKDENENELFDFVIVD